MSRRGKAGWWLGILLVIMGTGLIRQQQLVKGEKQLSFEVSPTKELQVTNLGQQAVCLYLDACELSYQQNGETYLVHKLTTNDLVVHTLEIPAGQTVVLPLTTIWSIREDVTYQLKISYGYGSSAPNQLKIAF